MTEPATQSVAPGGNLRDAGLRCPRCDYNLTGLPEPRCPECGAEFDWEQVRLDAANPPSIAFERARGWGKLRGFALTWLTVLFAPWVFARQITKRVSTAHALVFGAACFSSTTLAFWWDMDLVFFSTWLTTAAAYVLLQAVWLTLLDFPGWRKPPVTLRFWLLAGCYTSAIMATEFLCGPPQFTLEYLQRIVSHGRIADYVASPHEPAFWIHWTQMVVWLTGLAICYFIRATAAGLRGRGAGAGALLTWLGLLVLYAAAVERLGAEVLYGLFDRWF